VILQGLRDVILRKSESPGKLRDCGRKEIQLLNETVDTSATKLFLKRDSLHPSLSKREDQEREKVS
jgi:hypothetical protein